MNASISALLNFDAKAAPNRLNDQIEEYYAIIALRGLSLKF
jgi:hypothetical protein